MSKDLVTQENKEQVNKRVEEIRELLRIGSTSFYLLCKKLAMSIKNEDHFTLCYDNANQYFVSEYGLKPATAWNYVMIWNRFESFLSNKEYEGIDYTRLVKLLPICHKSIPVSNIEELLHSAKTLLPNEFDDIIRERKGKSLRNNCEHELLPDTYSRCKKCSQWVKI